MHITIAAESLLAGKLPNTTFTLRYEYTCTCTTAEHAVLEGKL